jgi:hypothetical protein
MRSVGHDAVNDRYPGILDEALDLRKMRSAAEQAARHRGLPAQRGPRAAQASDASSVISPTPASARLTTQPSFAPCAAALKVASSIPGTLPTV